MRLALHRAVDLELSRNQQQGCDLSRATLVFSKQSPVAFLAESLSKLSIEKLGFFGISSFATERISHSIKILCK